MSRAPKVLLPLIFACFSLAYAQPKHSGSFTLVNPARVGTNTLAAGTYSMNWADAQGGAILSISGKRTNVSVPVTVGPSGGQDQVLLHQEGNTTVVDGFQTKKALLTVKTVPASAQTVTK